LSTCPAGVPTGFDVGETVLRSAGLRLRWPGPAAAWAAPAEGHAHHRHHHPHTDSKEDICRLRVDDLRQIPLGTWCFHWHRDRPHAAKMTSC